MCNVAHFTTMQMKIWGLLQTPTWHGGEVLTVEAAACGTVFNNNGPSENHYCTALDFPHVHVLDKQVALEVLFPGGRRKTQRQIF